MMKPYTSELGNSELIYACCHLLVPGYTPYSFNLTIDLFDGEIEAVIDTSKASAVIIAAFGKEILAHAHNTNRS